MTSTKWIRGHLRIWRTQSQVAAAVAIAIGDVVASSAKHVRTHAMLPTFGIVTARIAKIDQGV